MVKDHLGHVKYIQDTERQGEKDDECNFYWLFLFPSVLFSSSPRPFKLLPQTPTTHKVLSACLCVCDIHSVWVIREV